MAPLVWLGLLGFAWALGAPAPVEGVQSPPDSASLRERARRAQRSFEVRHRSLLPRTAESWGGGCDERIGRVCLRFEGGRNWEPTPEDPAVGEARRELLETLAQVGRSIPGDRWVLGQRIRYLGDEGRWGEAEDLARGCRGDPGWWCVALLGYALHRGGKTVEAQEAFRRAREQMDPREARTWMDPSPLLDYAQIRWIRDPGSLGRDEALDRFWRLADPLFLTPGNERLTEHYSRHFGTLLYEDASVTIGFGWERGLEQLLIRYGFAAGWERTRPGFGPMTESTVVEHHHPESRGLLPPFEALEDPSGIPEGVWVPVDEHPASASAPVPAPLVAEGVAQTAVLRRGGNLLVVAAYGEPRDTVLLRRRPSSGPAGTDGVGSSTPDRPPWEPSPPRLSPDTLAGLFLLPDRGDWGPLAVLGRGGAGTLRLEAPPGGYLLSLELWNPAGLWGARVRHGIRAEAVPPDVPTLSEILLLAKGEALPRDLEEALPRMLPSTLLPAATPLTVAWEVYGLGRRREPLSFRISLVEEEGSLVRRALKRLGLFGRAPVLSLAWEEGGFEGPGPLFRTVDLQLPTLGPGRYVLRLELELPYRSKIMSIRRLTLY